jgi:DNA-binding LacI/PurR family transcriptional regulator
MSKRPTIHDVAARAGVSKSLVSLAMRDSPAVAQASREAILAAAADLGYRPNAAARSLAARASRTVGVLVLDLHNPVFAEILDGVLAGVRARGYSTMVVTGGADPALEVSEIDKLLEFQAEGLVLVSHRLTPRTLRAIAAETPVTVVTRRDITGPGIDTVCNDDRLGAQSAVDHLISLGHRRIAHISGGDDPVALEREQGYREAMLAAGLAEAIQVVAGRLDDAGGHAAASAALTGPHPPTALFVANDFAAIGAMAAVVDAGLAVPDDVSVVGYDGTSLGALRSISLTSVAQPLTEMGRLAADRLFARIQGRRGRARHLTVDARLVVRGSTGPVVPARALPPAPR